MRKNIDRYNANIFIKKMMNFNLSTYLVVLTGLKNDRNIYILVVIKNDGYVHSLSDRSI